MRYFDKLTNFFASAYTNSPKHNSNFLSYLRIFFERNNKYKSTFARLGNVFRNSKWSDLKIQNIKTPLISNWLSWALGLFLVSVLLLSFFGKSTASQTFINIPFLTDSFDVVFYVWANFINFVSLTWMQIWLTLVALKFSILQLMGFNNNYMYKAFNTSSVVSPTHVVSSTTNYKPFKLSPSSFYDSESLTLVHRLSKVNRSLGLLNGRDDFVSNLSKNHNPLLNKMYSLMPDVVSTLSSSKVRFQIQEVNSSALAYTLNTSTDVNWSGLDTGMLQSINNLSDPKFFTLDTNTLQALNNQEFGVILNNLNVYTNLTQAKQDRWLLRNSLLSNSSTVDLNAFTQTKKLIGINLFESAQTSKNIWNSSKMTQLTQTEELQKLSLFRNFLGFSNENSLPTNLTSLNEVSSGLQGFNWFETSSLWTTKKYFFTNQLKSNTINLTTIPNKSVVVNTYNPNSVFNFASNLHNNNLSFQLSDLNTASKSEVVSSLYEGSADLNSFVGVGDVDLLKSFNLNVINTLTLPITDKDASINNYAVVTGLKKKITISFKK